MWNSIRRNETRARVRVSAISQFMTMLCTLWFLTGSPLLANEAAEAILAANGSEHGSTDLTEMSLEELMNIEVTSVSKKSEPILHAPSAVFVITQEDIRRSGATCLPEALRLAPGVQALRMDASKWAVSVRGFNGSFANKLLVLIDGRSVYTPLFSGVYWDVQDVPLDDVERIEVIRGPGATLWGANAVNGVINITTKKTQETVASRANLAIGNKDKGTASFRLGRRANDHTSYRVWGKRLDYDNFEEKNGQKTSDQWNLLHGGFRMDWAPSGRTDFTFQGDAYTGEMGQTKLYPTLEMPYYSVRDVRGSMAGANLIGRWQHRWSEKAATTLQAFVDVNDRNDQFINARLTTLDLDCQQDWSPTPRSEIVIGAGLRHISDDIDPTMYVAIISDQNTYDVQSAFAQAKYDIVKDRVSITAGSKIENNSYTGFEYQPSLRALWSPSYRISFWGAVSRAVRTPSRGERMANLWLGVIPPLTAGNTSEMLIKIEMKPSEQFKSERLMARELGFRFNPSENLWIDAAFFANEYSGLINGLIGQVQPLPTNPPTLELPMQVTNGGNLKSNGLEVAIDWHANQIIRSQFSYSYLNPTDFETVNPDVISLTTDPSYFYGAKHTLGVRLLTSPVRWCNLDLWARYVSRIPKTTLEAYTGIDARFAVRPVRSLELALVGKDLLEDQHTEFIPEIFPYEVKTPRQVHCTVSWEF